MDIILVRLFLIVFVTFTCYWLRPFGPDERLNAAIGAVLGAAIIIFEWRLHRVSLKRLIGAAIGSILGIFGAYLFRIIAIGVGVTLINIGWIKIVGGHYLLWIVFQNFMKKNHMDFCRGD